MMEAVRASETSVNFNVTAGRYIPEDSKLHLIICVKLHLFILSGRAMAQAVSRRPIMAKDRVRARVSPCRICGGQSDTGTDFSPSYSDFACQYVSTMAVHIRISYWR
jgi:hypothetical protein